MLTVLAFIQTFNFFFFSYTKGGNEIGHEQEDIRTDECKRNHDHQGRQVRREQARLTEEQAVARRVGRIDLLVCEHTRQQHP